jgi:hypothetical protein
VTDLSNVKTYELRGIPGPEAQLEYARRMAWSPGRDPANVLRDVRGALGLDRNTGEPLPDERKTTDD